MKGYGTLTIVPSLDRILEVDTQGNILDVIGVKIHEGKVHLNWVNGGIREAHDLTKNVELKDTGLTFNTSEYLKSFVNSDTVDVNGDGKGDFRTLTQLEGEIPA